MTDPTATGPEADSAGKFRQLPPAVKLEDTIASHDSQPLADAQLGGVTETEFMLRHAG